MFKKKPPPSASHVLDHLALWIEMGQQSGYCSEVICGIHDGPPVTETENKKIEEGEDPCIPIVRIWAPE